MNDFQKLGLTQILLNMCQNFILLAFKWQLIGISTKHLCGNFLHLRVSLSWNWDKIHHILHKPLGLEHEAIIFDKGDLETLEPFFSK